jgi:hypothetical protein
VPRAAARSSSAPISTLITYSEKRQFAEKYIVKAITTIAARIVIMKAEKILWNKLNFNFFPLSLHLEVGGKRPNAIKATFAGGIAQVLAPATPVPRQAVFTTGWRIAFGTSL